MGYWIGSFVPLAPFIMVVAIVWVTMHYKHKYPRDSGRPDRHGRRGRQREDQATAAEPEAEAAPAPSSPDSADLIQIAERMEQRIAALEQLLDAKSPGWRNRHD